VSQKAPKSFCHIIYKTWPIHSVDTYLTYKKIQSGPIKTAPSQDIASTMHGAVLSRYIFW